MFWELVSVTGNFDLGFLSESWCLEGGVSQPTDPCLKRELAQARSDLRWGEHVKRKKQKIEEGGCPADLTPSGRAILQKLEKNMLRLEVNELTLETGHGDIRLANGNRVAIGGSSGGATRRLLDGYLLPDIPDLESLRATDMELLEADARE